MQSLIFYKYKPAEEPGVARGIKKKLKKKFLFLKIKFHLPPGYPWVLSKNVSPFAPAV